MSHSYGSGQSQYATLLGSINPNPLTECDKTRGVVPLRHLTHVPQTVWRLWLKVYRTKLTLSFRA